MILLSDLNSIKDPNCQMSHETRSAISHNLREENVIKIDSFGKVLKRRICSRVDNPHVLRLPHMLSVTVT